MRGTNGEKVIRLIRVFKTKCMSEGIKVSAVIAAKLIVGTQPTEENGHVMKMKWRKGGFRSI